MKRRGFKQGFDLDAAVGKRQLTKDGKEWLTLALDPFHDWNVPIAGYPDADCSNTVVQCFQYQTDLVTPNAAWDCHIRVNQHISNKSESEYNGVAGLSGSIIQTAVAAPAPDGILQILRVDAGQVLCPTGLSSFAPAGMANSILGPVADLVTSNSRVIGLGFEVINTSAEIYKQGTITCYKMPQVVGKSDCLFTNTADTATAQKYPTMLRYPPSSTAVASSLHGTVAWEAAKGAYVVCTQNSTNNDLSGVTYSPVVRTISGPIEAGAYIHATQLNYSPVAKPTTAYTGYPAKVIPFNTHGVMVTGLNASSTLRLRLRVYVERAPSPGSADASLIPLATPSAGYDAAALKMYSEIVSRMPVAVPVDFNSFGDWWKIISGIAKTVAVPVGALVGGPGGAAVGGAVSAGLSGLDQVFLRRRDPKGAGPVSEVNNPGSKAFKLLDYVDASNGKPPRRKRNQKKPPTKKSA